MRGIQLMVLDKARRLIHLINFVGPKIYHEWCGTSGSQRRTRVDRCSQGGGDFWRCVNVDGRTGQSFRFDLHPGDDLAENDRDDFRSVRMRCYF